MAKFKYKAVDQSSSIIEGVITANDEFEIEKFLREQGLFFSGCL